MFLTAFLGCGETAQWIQHSPQATGEQTAPTDSPDLQNSPTQPESAAPVVENSVPPEQPLQQETGFWQRIKMGFAKQPLGLKITEGVVGVLAVVGLGWLVFGPRSRCRTKPVKLIGASNLFPDLEDNNCYYDTILIHGYGPGASYVEMIGAVDSPFQREQVAACKAGRGLIIIQVTASEDIARAASYLMNGANRLSKSGGPHQCDFYVYYTVADVNWQGAALTRILQNPDSLPWSWTKEDSKIPNTEIFSVNNWPIFLRHNR